jgi:hypothetical protein
MPSARRGDTPLWKLEAAAEMPDAATLAAGAHDQIKLTATQEITPYQWLHPGMRSGNRNETSGPPRALSGMPRLRPPATGPMNLQPIEHGADMAAQPQSTKAANTAAQKKQSPRANAARIANAKTSRRKSLKKQREAQKVSGDQLHPDEER